MKKSYSVGKFVSIGSCCAFVLVSCLYRFLMVAPPMHLFVTLNDLLFVSLIPLAFEDPKIISDFPSVLGVGLIVLYKVFCIQFPRGGHTNDIMKVDEKDVRSFLRKKKYMSVDMKKNCIFFVFVFVLCIFFCFLEFPFFLIYLLM